MKPMVEELERRDTPAPLLAVSAAQAAQIHAIATGQDGADQGITLPPAAGDSVAIALDLTPEDGLWDSGNALVWLFRGQDVLTEGGPADPQQWYVGAVIWGCGDNGLAYSTVYARDWGARYVQLTLDPASDGLLPADAVLVNTLLASQPGDSLDNGALVDGLDLDPLTLAAANWHFDEFGEPTGDGTFTLQLAVAVEGGYRVHTLTLTGEFGEPAWALESSVFAATLTPDIWQLTPTE